MARGQLDDATLVSIDQQLPDFDALQGKILWAPDFLSIVFPYESEVPVAAVCLNDSVQTVAATRYALHEYLAHGVYYRQHTERPNEAIAVFFERYYLDDAALRLYSAAEQLAEAVVMMLEVSQDDLEPHRKRGTSLWVKVRSYLRVEYPAHQITAGFDSLSASEEWKLTMAYRGQWVHNQPPTVEGLGIVHHRRRKWEPSSDGTQWVLGVGGGERPKYTTHQLGKAFLTACFQFVEVLGVAADYYVGILTAQGIEFGDEDQLRVNPFT